MGAETVACLWCDAPAAIKGLCRTHYRRDWAARNPQRIEAYGKSQLEKYHASPVIKARVAAKGKRGFLRRRYGLTVEQLESMLVAQENTCAMPACHKNITSDPQVDHDHVTGRVRGLLCRECNLALGHWEKLRGRAEIYLGL